MNKPIDFGQLVKKHVVILLSQLHRDWTDTRKTEMADIIVDKIAKDLVDTRLFLDADLRGDGVSED